MITVFLVFMKVLKVNDVKGVNLGNIAIRKTLVYSDNMMMHAEAKPGGPPIAHSHPHEQMGYVLQGKVELEAGGKTVALEAGSSYYIEPNEYHVIRDAGSTENIIILDIFHPARDEYKP